MKKIFTSLLTVTTLTVVLANIVFFVIDNNVHALDDLPVGVLEKSTAQTDLDKPYVVSFYRVEAGGTLGTAFRAEATDLNTGRTYNIYWDKMTDNGPTGVVYAWISDDVMLINGHSVELSENGAHYDYRSSTEPDGVLPNGLRTTDYSY